MTRHTAFWTMLALAGGLSGCGPAAFRVEVVPARADLFETRIGRGERLFGNPKVAVIDIDGFLANRRRQGLIRSGENPVSLLAEKLDKAAADPKVRAVVLRIDSPGGTVAASDLMYHSLMRFKAATSKPIVASILDIGASGGYYLACAADGIVVQPAGVTGSIGTIMQTVSIQGTLDKIGMKTLAIKSGRMKDMASPLHDITPEEQEALQGIIDHLFENFFQVVRRGRPAIPQDRLRELADGRVYTAKDALDNGLIDRIGYPDDAIAWAMQMASIETADIVIYHRAHSHKPNVYASAESDVGGAGALVNIEIPDWLESPGTHFLYLWQPGLN